jgi:hypothetical protein
MMAKKNPKKLGSVNMEYNAINKVIPPMYIIIKPLPL